MTKRSRVPHNLSPPEMDNSAHTLDMKAIGIKLGFHEGRYFLTREDGERAYRPMVERLKAIPSGTALVCILPPAHVMDASFADETVIRIVEKLMERQFGERSVVLQSANANTVNNVNAAVSLRNLDLALLAVEPDGGWQILGHLDKTLAETLSVVGETGPLKAADLARRKRISIHTASTRLKRLYDRCLVRREHSISPEKGLEYIYSFWTWR